MCQCCCWNAGWIGSNRVQLHNNSTELHWWIANRRPHRLLPLEALIVSSSATRSHQILLGDAKYCLCVSCTLSSARFRLHFSSLVAVLILWRLTYCNINSRYLSTWRITDVLARFNVMRFPKGSFWNRQADLLSFRWQCTGIHVAVIHFCHQ